MNLATGRMRNSVFFLLISISSGLASFHYPTWSTKSVAHFSSGSLWSGVTDQRRKAKICHTDSVVAVAAVAERLMGGGGGARRWQVPTERASERRNWRRVPLGCERADMWSWKERRERRLARGIESLQTLPHHRAEKTQLYHVTK